MSEIDWMDGAACADLDVDPNIFHLQQGWGAKEARSICNRCPVKNECLDYAVARPSLHGTWGGTTHRERELMRSARNEHLNRRRRA